MAGANAPDVVLKVPVGTEVLDEDNETLIADLTELGQRVRLAEGGNGGFGNTHFKSSVNQAPRRANPGLEGQEKWIWLRLKLIADIGIVGKPNAGKSTFLARVTSAKPKIADSTRIVHRFSLIQEIPTQRASPRDSSQKHAAGT